MLWLQYSYLNYFFHSYEKAKEPEVKYKLPYLTETKIKGDS